jgi:hypothetical protein
MFMKSNIGLIITVGILFLLLFAFSGCYTQLGTTQSERDSSTEAYTPSEQENDSDYVADDEGGEYHDRYSSNTNYYYTNMYGWSPRYSFGFSYYTPSYYWPSYAFSVAYADPWFYDSYWAYDPWWCGTPSLGYSYGYYPPYYHHPWYGYGYSNNSVNYGPRAFGSTRGERDNQGVRDNFGTVPATSNQGSYSLPTGARLDRSTGGTSARTTPVAKQTSRRTGNLRKYIPRPDVRGTSSHGNNRSTDTQYAPNTGGSSTTSAPSTRNTGEQREQSSGGRDAGSSRSNAPSYTPPQQSPPPANNNERGSEVRSPRR